MTTQLEGEELWNMDYKLQNQILVMNTRLNEVVESLNVLIEDNAKLKQRLLVLYKDKRDQEVGCLDGFWTWLGFEVQKE